MDIALPTHRARFLPSYSPSWTPASRRGCSSTSPTYRPVPLRAGGQRLDAGEAPGDALAAGFSRVALVMAVLSALGIPLALLMGRHQSTKPTRAVDYAVAAASNTHTMPRPEPQPVGA